MRGCIFITFISVHCCKWLGFFLLLSRTYRQRSCRSLSTGHARFASFQQMAPYQMWRFGNLLLLVERWHTRFALFSQKLSVDLIQIARVLCGKGSIQKSDLIDIPESFYELSLLLVFVLPSRWWWKLKSCFLNSWTGSFRDTVSVRVVSSVREWWPSQSNWWAQRFASRPWWPCPGW